MSKPASPQPLYLLLGPETGKKNAFIGDIREALTLGGSPPEEYHFYAFETSIQDVVSLLRNASLFASRKLVIYNGAEDLHKKDELALLAAYAKKPSPDGVLVFVSDTFQTDKKLADCVGAKGTQKFYELFDNEKKGWIINCFARHKARITSGAADLFLDLVENTTTEFERECVNLCLFKGENAEITTADIETYLYHSRQETVYSLFATVCALDLEMSLEILAKLLLEGSSGPVQLLGGLFRQFRSLRSYSQLLSMNIPAADAFASLKIVFKRSQRTHTEGARNFSAAQLDDIINLCADFDEYLRSGGADMHSRLLEIFLYCVIRKKGANIA
ncbi:MAG: DNA polymerase III subunit delta [Spirochaetales bacterium]|jgi:DNA polymerase-3 subunit delta|nr:DNA polymerase III subunit delta [Spirochaetales bacterium]